MHSHRHRESACGTRVNRSVSSDPPKAKIISPGELEVSQLANSKLVSLSVRGKFIDFG